MSIAELIMTGTNRASESTAWVGDSLAKLGQNVGQALAQREQQKQAQEMLPFLQQNMQDAMALAGEGDTAGAYSKMIPFLTDPSVARNPFVNLPALVKGVEIAADDFQRKELLRITENMYGAKTDYQNSLLALRENQAETKAELDARRLQLQSDYYNTRNENEKNRIGIELQKLELDARELDYKTRYGGGGTGDGGGVDVNAMLSALNQGGDTGYTDTVSNQPDIYSKAGARGEQFPFKQAVSQSQPQGVTAMNQPLQGTPEQQAMQAGDMEAQLIGPMPGEAQPPLAQGPIRKEEPPSQKTLKRFTQLQDYFNALPLKEQKYKMDQTSVIFKDKDSISSYKPPKGTGVVQLSKAAGIGVPDAFAVQLPAEVSKYVLGGVNISKDGGVSYNIDKKIEGNTEAKDAVKWLQDWQSASVAVGSNPKLRDLLSQAGNDALNIDISDAPKDDLSTDGGRMIELQVRDKPDTKIQVPESAGKLVQMLQAQTSAANTHNAKFLRLKQEQPKTQTAQSEYRSAEDVRSAVKSGRLTREQAMGILKSQFGYQ